MSEIQLSIDQKTCIRCGKCVRICPATIFIQREDNKEVTPERIASCIKCGHCVGVCPTSSVLHSSFPQSKVHTIQKELLPTPEQTMMLIKSRRSNRAISSKPIPMEYLDQIIEAAHRAPTASNLQQVSFTLITDPEKIQKIIDLTFTIFGEFVQRLENVFMKPILKRVVPQAYQALPYIHHLTKEYKKGEDPIFRGAKTLLLIHTPKESRFGCQDANLAYQNGSLMAESLGVTQIYTGFLCTVLQQDKKNRIPLYLGIEGVIHAGMALAMPSFRFEKYIDKQEVKIKRL